MFIANLTYIKNLSEVEYHLDSHISFLDKFYKSGHFIASGRKVPRTGGIILINAKNQNELESIISQDPFYQHQIANYDIIEFIPSKYSKSFSEVLK